MKSTQNAVELRVHVKCRFAATASPCVNCQTARYWHMEDKPLTLAALAFLALLTLAGIAGAVNYLTP